MWVLSSLLIYEPANALTQWHPQKLSLCHNMQIFETLFALSCIVAAFTGVRHLSTLWHCAALSMILLAVCVAQMPNVDLASRDNDGWLEDWRWSILPQTLPRLLPASLVSMLLAMCKRPACLQSSRLGVFLAMALFAVTFALDFLTWGQGHISGNWRLADNAYQRAFQVWGQMLSVWARRPWLQRALAVLFELPHVLGVAVLVWSGEHVVGAAPSTAGVSWWAFLSRLSLGINISNIFALHYITARFHDHPLEYSTLHMLVYGAVAWFCAAALALCSHCLSAPWVSFAHKLCALT